MSYTLTPTTITNNQVGFPQPINFKQPNPAAVRMINLSPYILLIQEATGDQDWLEPGSIGTYLLEGQSGNFTYTPEQIVNTVANFPVNAIYATVFNIGDNIPTPGKYSLGIYQFGGTLVTNEAVATVLDNNGLANPGSPSGTNDIIRVSLVGNAAQPVFAVGPDGSIDMDTLSDGTFISVLSVTPGDNFNPSTLTTQGQLVLSNEGGNTYFSTDKLGNVTFALGTIAFNNPANSISFLNPIAAQLKANSNGQLIPVSQANGAAWYSNYNSGGPTLDLDVATTSGGAGIRLVYRDSTNALQVGLTIRQSDGRITNVNNDILKGSSTFTGTGTGTFSHGLGKTPTLILVMQTSGTGAGYVVTAITSTQCTITWASGTPTFTAIAFE